MKNQFYFLLFTVSLLTACSSSKSVQQVTKEKINYTFSAEAAPDWTALFERTSGWFGADGIFSIPLNGKENQGDERAKTLFIFSDTYIGEVENKVPKPGNIMVNNTTARMTGLTPEKSAISFEYQVDKEGKPISYFIPNNANSKEGEYFWLGDGFINSAKKNALYVFAYHVHKTGPNVFDFAQTEIALLKIKNPSSEGLSNYEQIPTSLGFVHPEEGRVYFGSGIFANTKAANAPFPDGYIYIYGLMEKRKTLVAARTHPKHIENIEKWTFWNGEKWTNNKAEIAPITPGVSNELSVTPTKEGKYLLTFQILGISDKVGIQVGESPIGPFGPIQEVYTCPEYKAGLLPYNAKAHYHLSKPGELLVSYNTITFDFWKDIQKDATIYHPRFIRVKYEVAKN